MMNQPKKQDVANVLLQLGLLRVHLDPRRSDVVVPAKFKDKPSIILEYGLNLAIPIRDLVIDEKGIRATLSFDKVNMLTVVPWSAVYAISNQEDRGMLWPDDVPAGVRVDGAPPKAETPKPKPSHLKLVKN